MEWTTHALSGIVAGYAVSGGDWKGAVVGGIAGVIPDLDEHKSKFGKLFFPVSYIINKIFGHRTLTHSLLFVVIIGSDLMLFFDSWVWLSASVGILVHFAGDMLTGKVKFLYPYQKSIGLSVGQFTFVLMDRGTRTLLALIVLYKCYGYLKIFNYIKGAVNQWKMYQ